MHFPQQNGALGEQDSDKENQGTVARGRGRGGLGGTGDSSQVITASTWLSNILPAPKEDGSLAAPGAGSAREQSPSPQHKSLTQVRHLRRDFMVITTTSIVSHRLLLTEILAPPTRCPR